MRSLTWPRTLVGEGEGLPPFLQAPGSHLFIPRNLNSLRRDLWWWQRRQSLFWMVMFSSCAVISWSAVLSRIFRHHCLWLQRQAALLTHPLIRSTHRQARSKALKPPTLMYQTVQTTITDLTQETAHVQAPPTHNQPAALTLKFFSCSALGQSLHLQSGEQSTVLIRRHLLTLIRALISINLNVSH